MKKILYAATVAKKHICQFHIPYLKWFRDHGCVVHVAARDDFESGDQHLIPYCDTFYNIPFNRSPFSADNLRAYRQIKRLIRENDYDLIHCHTPVASAVVRLAARKNPAAVLYTSHGFHFYKGCPKSGEIYRLLEKMLIPYTDALITINREDYEAAQKFCKGRDCEVFYVHGMGVDTGKFARFDGDAAALRKRFGIPPEAFLLLSVSEINANKNLVTAIDAFSRVMREDMYYLICGTGAMMDECRERARQLGVSDRVIFAGYRHDVHEIVHIADAFIFPSLREGFGVAPIEAMSAGVPIIASDVRGVREYAADGKNSVLVRDPLDVESFAKAIALLRDDAALRKTLGENAAASVAPFDLAKSLDAMEAIYRAYVDLPRARDAQRG